MRKGPNHSSARAARAALAVAVFAWGVQAIVTQSLLVREALVLMSGIEFAWGVVFFAWLLGVAVGAVVGGRLADRRARGLRFGVDPVVALAVVLAMLSAAVPFEIWVFRGARTWLGVPPGELLPLGETMIAAVAFLAPVSALVGMAFPLACAACSRPAANAPPNHATGGTLGGVYAIESLGGLVGGALFSFWAVERLSPVQTALLSGAVTTGAAAILPAALRRRRSAVALAAVAGAAAAVAVLAGDSLNRRLVQRRWRTVAAGYELRAETESKHQNLAVGQREEQYALYADGQLCAVFPDPYTVAPLAHFWACQHPSPRRVLVLGGGAEGLLAEILRHPIDHLDYVEPDPRQLGLVEPYLPHEDRQAIRDQRVTIHPVDARYFVKTQRDRFDLVIARLPEPTSVLRARFYTDEFYGELRRAMTPQAVFCTTAAAAPTALTQASAEYLGSVRAALRRHFDEVVVGWGDPAQVLAATAKGLITTDPNELKRRYAARGVGSAFFVPQWFDGATDWLEPGKLRQRAAELDAASVQVGTDLRPVICMQRLTLWERMTGGRSGRMIERLRGVGWGEVAVGSAAALAITMTAFRLAGRSRGGWATGAVMVSMGTTGFATMALSIIWLFAFQSLYGYVYQRIGWIVALFMGGLVVGCLMAGRTRTASAGSPRFWPRLVAVDLLLALLALSLPLVLPKLAEVHDTETAFILIEWTISLLVAATGMLCGAAFAVAGSIQSRMPGPAAREGAVAGGVVGADHVGACLGALLTGVVFIPVFGTVSAALLLAVVKCVSAVLIVMAARKSSFSSSVTCAGDAFGV